VVDELVKELLVRNPLRFRYAYRVCRPAPNGGECTRSDVIGNAVREPRKRAACRR
jgi:hypothetical protein